VIVTPTPFDLNLMQHAPGAVRGVGLHMSDIYGALYKELEPKRYDRLQTGTLAESENKAGFMGIGMAFEDMLEKALRDRLTEGSGRPDELTESEYGIIYNPDLVIFNGSTRVGEIKLTWMSSKGFPREQANGFPPKADKYLTQMMAYCRCLETPYARLYACFVNGSGSFKDQFGPSLMAWDITFTSRELEENWRTLISYAKQKRML